MAPTKLTQEDVFYLMNLAKNENIGYGIRGRKENAELNLLLKLMYYCHLTMKDALSLKPSSLFSKGLKDCFGIYKYQKKGLKEKTMKFEMTFVFYRKVQEYIKNNNIRDDEYIIKRKKRSLQYAFQQLVKEAHLENVRLIDVKYAGEYYYRSTRPPYEV